MSRGVRLGWRIVLSIFALACVILAAAGGWAVVGFSLLFGVGFGTLAYRSRERYARAVAAAGFGGYLGFVATVIGVSVGEELLCAAFGCQLAHPVIWVDLILVSTLWLVWLSTWYFAVAPRYKLDFDEALFIAACAGVLFEIVGKPSAVANPVLAVLASGPVIVVYAAITALPLSLVKWRGTREGRAKYAIAFLVPYLACLPALGALFILFSALGVAL